MYICAPIISLYTIPAFKMTKLCNKISQFFLMASDLHVLTFLGNSDSKILFLSEFKIRLTKKRLVMKVYCMRYVAINLNVLKHSYGPSNALS